MDGTLELAAIAAVAEADAENVDPLMRTRFSRGTRGKKSVPVSRMVFPTAYTFEPATDARRSMARVGWCK